MSLGHEIDYDALIDRAIKDFEPVKRLWPVGTRLFFWILLESAILALTGAFLGYYPLPAETGKTGLILSLGLPIFASIVAAFFALRGAVPGREVSSRESMQLLAVVCGALLIPDGTSALTEGGISAVELFGLASLPWSVLFWVVRRGVPLQPEKTGVIIGLAAFSFALAVLRFIDYENGFANQIIWLGVCGILFTVASALAGRLWLDWIDRWQQSPAPGEVRAATPWLDARTVFPIAIAGSVVALILVLQGGRHPFVPIRDFDLTIDNYERSLAGGFRSNVPSPSIDSMLTAYVEHGMPAYMWDFGPEGFKLVGGRWEPLPDGTPVTYTWFRGAEGGVICMIRQVEEFNPPSAAHEEHHRLLFYRYRGFSLCLINICGYGNFICVIAAPMPMKQFVGLILAVI